MLVAERDANVIRTIDQHSGKISTLAGTGTPGFGGDGGPSQKAQLRQPHSIALDRMDNLYICDIQNNRVRCRDARTGLLTTFAGNGEVADTPDEAPLATSLHGPRSIDIGPDGTMYLILREGNKVFSIDPVAKTLKRIAGSGAKGYAGDKGPARYGQVAVALNTTEGALKVAVHRLRGRYRELLREEIARTVNDPSEVETEIRSLFAALAP